MGAAEEPDVGPASVSTAEVLAGGGEMGALMRSIDWSASAIGPVERWPQSLRTAVGICLNSRFPMLIWWGPEFVKLYNDAYRPMLGTTKHPRAMGQRGRECWPEIWDIIGPMLEGVLFRGEATWSDDQLLILDRNGYLEECYFTFSYSPIRDETGGVGGIFTAVTETTGRVLGERRLRTLRELAARAGDAKTAEEACRIAAESMAGNHADLPFALLYLLDAEGRHATLVGTANLEPGGAAAPQCVDVSIASGGIWPLASVVRTHQAALVDDLPIRVDGLSAGPWPVPPHTALVLPVLSLTQERLTGLLVVGISPRRALDDDYHGFLELVAGHVATAIANAQAYEQERQRAEALAELDRAKTAFFSNVSHEFRTPLTLMLGPLEDMLARANETAAVRKDELELVHRSGLRLLKLVNTLLDFSRIEAGRVQAVYESIDLAALTADLASAFRSAIERVGMRLYVDCPPLPEPVYVDRDMWEKIVLNLLSNAFKFTFKGEITVTLRPGPGHVELTVRDTGIGIPQAELPHLFERFHRVRGARSRTHEGTGIGLALVQELVRLHGGSMQVHSVDGYGSAFTVSIPFGTAHLPADRIGGVRLQASTALGVSPYIEEALRWSMQDTDTSASLFTLQGAADPLADLPPRTGDETARGRVLVADDNADMREYVVRLLHPRYEVAAVADGDQALAAARAYPPDLVLTDVMMPGLDGFELLRELRANPSTSTIPVILLSARAGEESRVEGLDAGADDYLVKPFSARELLARVTSHLEMGRLRRQATERERRLRAEVEESRRRLESILDSISDSFVILDPAWRVIYVNQKASEFAQRPKETLVGKVFWEEFPATLGSRFETELHRAMAEQTPVHFEYFYGPWDRWFEHHVYPSSEGVTLFSSDITSRIQAEDLFRTLSHSSLIGMFIVQDGLFQFGNPQFEQCTGYRQEEVIGKPCLMMVLPEDRAIVREQAIKILQGERTSPYEYRFQTKTGKIKWIAETVNSITYRGRRAVLANFMDITERKQVEETLQLLTETLAQRVAERTALIKLLQEVTVAANAASSIEDALRLALERICAYTQWPVGHACLRAEADAGAWVSTPLWHLDETDRFAAFRQATERFQPVADAGLIDRVVASARPAWIDDPASDLLEELAQAAKEVGLRTAFACPLLIGKEVVGLLEFFSPAAMHVDAALLDIMAQIGTQLGRVVERQRAIVQLQRQQEVLAQSEKLAAMGSLLASVAHELNNPLAVVAVAADLLQEEIGTGPLVEHASKITQAAERCASIVQHFLMLARQHPPERTQVQLNTIVQEAVGLLEYSFRVDDIALQLHLAPDLPELRADAHQLQQVVVNLLTNAHQAMRGAPPPQRLTLTTCVDNQGQQVTLTVADSGPGIPPALRSRIFEPFFTTKPPGVGTGLGLSLCRGIIEGHGGSIEVRSEPGQGATFLVTLPAGPTAMVTEAPQAMGNLPPIRGQSILIVDDEVGIRSALAYLLRRDGHEVDTATNGVEALAKLQSRSFDLILCDLRMPELDGPALYRALQDGSSQLQQRFIFLTGDTLSPETRDFLEQVGVPRLTKPFTAREARRVVEQALQALWKTATTSP
jgi:PAS domain S-box-containing protein